MDFFGITHCGSQNYIKDVMREDYKEPLSKEEVRPLMESVIKNSHCPKDTTKLIKDVKIIDCYVGQVNGFAYGSKDIFKRMRTKGIVKPVGPTDMYRHQIATSMDYGWWRCDPALQGQTWYLPDRRFPQQCAPNTKIFEIAKLSNKYASLF